MKVWIVMPDYEYDGWGEPRSAHSSRELADAAVADLIVRGFGPSEIFELEIDAPKKDQ